MTGISSNLKDDQNILIFIISGYFGHFLGLGVFQLFYKFHGYFGHFQGFGGIFDYFLGLGGVFW